jgi:hypothetical protein
MKLARFVVASFPESLSSRWFSWKSTLGPVELETWGRGSDEGRVFIWISASTPLVALPELDSDGRIKIPEDPRTSAEEAIEAFVNMIAVSERCDRQLSSPFPPVTFVPETETDRRFLSEAGPIKLSNKGIPQFASKLLLSPRALAAAIIDRLDGVSLLAEAQAHRHPTGQMHELVRFFERAFFMRFGRLGGSLGRFLEQGTQDFTRREVEGWRAKRGPVFHADSRDSFELEAGTRALVPRMEQAAFDVLLNKATWRDPSAARRDVWQPDFGPLGADDAFFVTIGRAATISIRALDGFGAYPQLLKNMGIKWPSSHWAVFDEDSQLLSQAPMAARAGRCIAASSRGARCLRRVTSRETQLCSTHRKRQIGTQPLVDYTTGDALRYRCASRSPRGAPAALLAPSTQFRCCAGDTRN